jgi:nicotinamidase-related amidase
MSLLHGAGARDTPALIVVDVERGLIDGFEDDWSEVLPVVSELAQRARDAGLPLRWSSIAGRVRRTLYTEPSPGGAAPRGRSATE